MNERTKSDDVADIDPKHGTPFIYRVSRFIPLHTASCFCNALPNTHRTWNILPFHSMHRTYCRCTLRMCEFGGTFVPSSVIFFFHSLSTYILFECVLEMNRFLFYRSVTAAAVVTAFFFCPFSPSPSHISMCTNDQFKCCVSVSHKLEFPSLAVVCARQNIGM